MKKKNVNLKNVTPQSLRCAGIGCPSIYEAEDDSYVIIGKLVSKTVAKELKNSISEAEAAINVPKRLLEKLRTK